MLLIMLNLKPAR